MACQIKAVSWLDVPALNAVEIPRSDIKMWSSERSRNVKRAIAVKQWQGGMVNRFESFYRSCVYIGLIFPRQILFDLQKANEKRKRLEEEKAIL